MTNLDKAYKLGPRVHKLRASPRIKVRVKVSYNIIPIKVQWQTLACAYPYIWQLGFIMALRILEYILAYHRCNGVKDYVSPSLLNFP